MMPSAYCKRLFLGTGMSASVHPQGGDRRCWIVPHTVTQGADSSDDEVSLMHMPTSANWQVRKRCPSISSCHEQVTQTALVTRSDYVMTCSWTVTWTLPMHSTNHTLPIHRALRPMALLRVRVRYTMTFFVGYTRLLACAQTSATILVADLYAQYREHSSPVQTDLSI